MPDFEPEELPVRGRVRVRVALGAAVAGPLVDVRGVVGGLPRIRSEPGPGEDEAEEAEGPGRRG